MLSMLILWEMSLGKLSSVCRVSPHLNVCHTAALSFHAIPLGSSWVLFPELWSFTEKHTLCYDWIVFLTLPRQQCFKSHSKVSDTSAPDFCIE